MLLWRASWRFMIVLLAFAALWLWGSLPARADGPWTSFDQRDGLLDDTVHALAATPAGEMLIGASGGLSIWDGTHFVSHSAGNGLVSGDITAVAAQGETLWAGSWGGGLAAYRNGHWRRYQADDSPLPGDWISALLATEDGLWIATYGRGLAHLAGETWRIYRRNTSALPSDWLNCLATDAAGGLWIGSERAGLAHLGARGNWLTYTLPFSDTRAVTALAPAEETLWVGTPRGLAALDTAGGAWRTFEQGPSLLREPITALALGNAGLLWVGTLEGLGAWDGQRLTTYSLREGLPHPAVSALAHDSAGRLWVGSYVRGVAVRGALAKPRIVRRPVVLVHGWRGPESDRLEDSEFWHLARWLREDGFEPYYVTGISPANTLHENAARLREGIAAARRQSGADKVYLIAFSMGGLNARAYLESTLYAGDVARAFILGTPHQGEHLWRTLLLWEHVAWSDEPSALELLPIHADLFNASHHPTGEVPYTLVAGDARAAELPTLFRRLPPGDGLVSTWSALGPDDPFGDPLAGPWERRVTEDIHAWWEETLLLDLPSLLFPRTTYDAHIRPYLFGEPQPPPSASVADAVAYERPSLPPRSALRAGEIAPGEVLALSPLPIEALGDARFYLRWKGPPLKMRLRDPLGREIDADEALEREDIEYLELGLADFAGYVLTATLPGPWQVLLESPPENEETSRYVVYAELERPTRMVLHTDRTWYAIGDTVTITAWLQDPTGYGRLHEVTLEVYRPDRQRERLFLHPIAPMGRGDREEGRFVGHLVVTQGGYYTLLSHGRGTYGARDLERGEALVIGVSTGVAHLGGPPRLEAMPGGDLQALVEVIARQEADLLCAVTLRDAAGEERIAVAHPFRAVPGEQIVSLRIPRGRLRVPDPAGYHIVRVLLLDISGAGIPLDVLEGRGALYEEP